MSGSRWVRLAFVAVVVALFVAAQVEAWMGPDVGRAGRAGAAVLAAGITLPLLYRRAPLAVLLVVLGCISLDAWLGNGLGWSWFAMLVAVYGLGSRGRTAEAVAGMAVVGGLVLAVDVPRLQEGAPADEVLPGWFVVVGVFGFGRWMRNRGRESAALLERARLLELEREQATRDAVAHERARIARELHDLVAHSLAVIVLQAQAGDRVLGTDVEEARAALASIEHVGRDGLAELRRLLDVLETPGADDEDASPSLRHVDELAARVTGTGVPVEVSVEGTPRPLPAGLDLSAYRIVQEALTNTMKHAGPARATVGVRYLPEALEIRVADTGTGPGDTATGRVGRGLIGMRERVALYGGTLVTRPGLDGGFEVRASFPVTRP